MKYLGSAVLGILGVIALSASASAAVVCNEDGDCWRVKEKYPYPPQAKVQIYEDDWKWADADRAKYRWRDPGEGRGYYRGPAPGAWIGF
jgi:hypothetical protein